MDGLVMWLTKGNCEKWGVLEASEMVLLKVLPRSAYGAAADLFSPQFHAAPPERVR
jgi:hypothetical protein